MKVKKVSEIIRKLTDDGWYLYQHSGTSHRQYKHQVKKGKVTINGKPLSEVTGDLLKSIENNLV